MKEIVFHLIIVYSITCFEHRQLLKETNDDKIQEGSKNRNNWWMEHPDFESVKIIIKNDLFFED